MAAVPSIGRASTVERPAAPVADATRDLYERFHSQIFGYCLHQLGSREEAEDATQTTFMNAFRGLERGIVPEIEQAWLFKIAHNVCLSRRRSSWRRGRVEAPNNMEVLQEVVPAREKVGDELIRLQAVLEQMPEGQRRAILLREWQGLSYREIAAELDVSQAAVETLIFRARRALAQGLEETPDGAGRSWRKRARRGADVGGLLAGMKALLGGGGAVAVKIAATLAVGTIAAVGASVSSPSPATGRAAAPARPDVRTAPATPVTSETLRRTAPAAFAGRETSGVTRSRSTVARPAAPAARPRPVPPLPDPEPELPPAASLPAAPEAHAPATATALAPPAPENGGNHAPKQDKPRRGDAAEPTRAPAAELPSHGRGHGKGHDKQPVPQDPAAAPQPPLPVADEPVAAPDQAEATGQQEKQEEHGADKADKDHGNGNGKGK